MDFVPAIKSYYRGFVKFEGRSCRSEYWWIVLYQLLLVFAYAIPLFVFAIATGDVDHSRLVQPMPAFMLIWFSGLGLILVVHFLPNLALSVRRFHDLGQTGWMTPLFMVLEFLPLVGVIAAIVRIVWFCMPGTRGPNQYGDDPLRPVADTFS